MPSNNRASAQTDNAFTIFDRRHSILAEHASISNISFFFGGSRKFLAQDAHFWWGGFHADVGLSHICENDGTLFADQVVQCMRLIFSERLRVWRQRRQALHLCNYMEAEVFVDGRLYVCHRNPFIIHAWCVKIAKKLLNRGLNGVQPK